MINSFWFWTEIAGGFEVDAEGTPNAITLDAQGRPHIFFSQASLAPHYYRYAHHDGQQWRYHVVDRYVMQWGGDVSIQIDKQRQTHLAYIQPVDATTAKLFYMRHDGRWRHDWYYIDKAIRPLYCSVAVDSLNQPHVVYYDGIPQQRLQVARYIGGKWETVTIADLHRSLGLWCSAAFDSKDQLHVACHDNDSFTLKYAVEGRHSGKQNQ